MYRKAYNYVCPTGVGMNRGAGREGFLHRRMPYRRGDEPLKSLLDEIGEDVCPTGVGMNRVA